MLHHASFNARDPETAARTLVGMLDATLIRAPSPPFPAGSWFVCYGDEGGSFLEVLPWGHTVDPDAPFGIGFDGAMRERAGSHVLVGTPRTIAEVEAAAAAAGWRCQVVDARLFKVVKVWVENTILVELLPAEVAGIYRETFGTAGLPSLDAKLRRLEAPPA